MSTWSRWRRCRAPRCRPPAWSSTAWSWTPAGSAPPPPSSRSCRLCRTGGCCRLQWADCCNWLGLEAEECWPGVWVRTLISHNQLSSSLSSNPGPDIKTGLISRILPKHYIPFIIYRKKYFENVLNSFIPQRGFLLLCHLYFVSINICIKL